jgi:hypothetical protein
MSLRFTWEMARRSRRRVTERPSPCPLGGWRQAGKHVSSPLLESLKAYGNASARLAPWA